MLKKLALALLVICTTPFLSPNFRQGFRQGWNDQYDKNVALGFTQPRFVRKFKNA